MAFGVETGVALVCLGDLAYETQAGAMSGEAVGSGAGILADAASACRRFAFDKEDDVTLIGKTAGADGAARRIVAHAVVQEIGEGAAQKLRIGAQRWQRCFGQIDVQRIVVGLAAVEKIGDRLSQERGRLYDFAAQRLHARFQPHGEIEIADEIAVISGGVLREMGPGEQVLPQLMAGSVHCDACAKREAVFA